MVDDDYWRRYAAKRRRRVKIEKGLDPNIDYRRRRGPPPEKPTKELRRRDLKAYQALYMRWSRWWHEARP